jgi:hypothetical protein
MRDNAANQVKFDEGKKIALEIVQSMRSVKIDQTWFQDLFNSSKNDPKAYEKILSAFEASINASRDIT